jgi:hypothetical protein
MMIWRGAKPMNAEIAEGDDDDKWSLLSMEANVGDTAIG